MSLSWYYFFSRLHRFPVIAYGVLRWVDYTVSDASYFKLNTDHTPLHLVLIDEVGFMYSSTNIYSIDLLITCTCTSNMYMPSWCDFQRTW